MVETPGDDVDPEDYDDLATYIHDAMADGYTIEASDFEGRPCSYCGDLLDFAEWQRNPDAVVTWDTRVHDPDCDEPEPYVHRDYFCSEECREQANRDVEWLQNIDGRKHDDGDRIHVDDVEGRI